VGIRKDNRYSVIMIMYSRRDFYSTRIWTNRFSTSVVAQQSSILECHLTQGKTCRKSAELAQLTGLLSCFATAADLRAVLPPVDEGSFEGQASNDHSCAHCQRTPPGYRRTDKGCQSFTPSSIWLTKGKRSKPLCKFALSRVKRSLHKHQL